MTTPLKQYKQDLKQNVIQPDAHQAHAVDVLQDVYDKLHTKSKKWFGLKRSKKFVGGAYFWGPVGTGKTYLMDLFYHGLKVPKMRLHFHEFMQDIHNQLKALEGTKNPIDTIVAQLAEKARVLCFDEFVVNNIVDAMVLANLFKTLFEQGVSLVTTSNVEPDELYHDGLQRELFLPAIDLINRHLKVVEIDNQVDYRLRKLTPEKAYFSPESADSEKQLQCWFQDNCKGEVKKETSIKVMHRKIAVKQMSDNVIWFEFDKLCSVPRSQRDYLAIVKQFHTVLISGVHVIEASHGNTARLFINLIDVLYDAHVRLIMSGSVALDQLYPSGDLSFEFKRTYSRLAEMQSKEYLLGRVPSSRT